jgi:hypothetical protein
MVVLRDVDFTADIRLSDPGERTTRLAMTTAQGSSNEGPLHLLQGRFI